MPSGGESAGGLEPVVDQTLVAALPDRGARGAATSSNSPAAPAGQDEIAAAMAAATWRQREAKMLARSHGGGASALSRERRCLWRQVYMKREGQDAGGGGDEAAAAAAASMYWDTVRTCFGSENDLPSDSPSSLPPFLDSSHTPSYCLKPLGRQSVVRCLTCLGYNRPDVQRCPVLFALASILRHYLSEEDTYGLVSQLVSSRSPKFLAEGAQSMEVEWRTAMQLNKKYNKKSLSQLSSVLTNPQEDLESLFRQWIWAIFECLPFPHIIRIVDCYLIEGDKVLHRVCLALVRLFGKRCRADPRGVGVGKRGLACAYLDFCRNIEVSPNELLTKAFSLRGLSRNTISSLALAAEVEVKAGGFAATTAAAANSAAAATDVGGVDAIRAASDNLTYQQLVQIWHWMPERLTTVTPTLAYSSDEHGVSLTTFYTRCENFEQTILIVKTVDGELFGAFCSAAWAERKYKDDRGMRQNYFGNGETFLFKLANSDGSGEDVKYPWVGLNRKDKGGGGGGDAGLSKAEEHARELFMTAQHDSVAIGGGGGNGLYLDSSMTFGKTERCATFDNAPLCKDSDFKVALVEVIGFNPLDL